MTTSQYYIDCNYCNGEGGHSEYCCSGYSYGVQDCWCAGRGTWKDCRFCGGSGKEKNDTIEWNLESLIEEDRDDHQVFYSIGGVGKFGSYIGTAVYTDGNFDEIQDIEKN